MVGIIRNANSSTQQLISDPSNLSKRVEKNKNRFFTWGSKEQDSKITDLNSIPETPNFLSGPEAFYNQPNYLEKTLKDFEANRLLPTAFHAKTEYFSSGLPLYIKFV